MKFLLKLAICLTLISILTACKKNKNFPDEPVLEVREFIRLDNDNAVWKIGFTDGDGDFGIRVNDTGENFFTTIYYFERGVRKNLNDLEGGSSNAQNYRIPRINGVNTGRGVEGEISLELPLDLFQLSPDPILDSVMYEAFVVDRAGNISNTVFTPIIFIPSN